MNAYVPGICLVATVALGPPQSNAPRVRQPDPCTAIAGAPADVSLLLSLADSRTTFRQGEIVSLRLDFTSTTIGKYFVDTRNYDRSGRLGIEAMCLQPNTPDPLADYYGSGLFGFIGGGIGGRFELGEYRIEQHLNEWKALPPGRYRLRVVSSRVSGTAPADDLERGERPVPLASNTIDFEVVRADAAWQAAQLEAAREGLDAVPADTEKGRRAARILRFLGSTAAANELVQRFYSLRQPHGWDLMFGLVASPHRAQIIQAMAAAIRDPDHPITDDFLSTLAQLDIQSNPALARLEYREKRAAYAARLEKHRAELRVVFDAKTGQARALTAETLLGANRKEDTATRERSRRELIASWDSLPVRLRNELIQYRWKEIAGPEMLPILRGIVNAPPNRNRQVDMLERGPALKRIYELAPEEGRSLILAEILDTKGDIEIDVLGLLPDRELPQVEQRIVPKLREGRAFPVDYHLLARYASAAPLEDVKTVYRAHVGQWACDHQNAMLRYFLKVDPAYGAAALAEALTHRKVTGCFRVQFSGIGEFLQVPTVEQLAISALNDSSYEVVKDAADALGKYGSADAEPALWQRLRTFHETWRGKEEQLRFAPGMAVEDLAPMGAESALVRAIATGRGWTFGPEKLGALRQIVSPARLHELERLVSRSP